MGERYEIRREVVAGGFVEISPWLVRDRRVRLWRGSEPVRRVVARRFGRSRTFEMERFNGELDEIVEYARRGEWGCFLHVRREGPESLRVRVFERWFDGASVETELLAEHRVRLPATGSLDLPNQLAGELRGWMAARDAERELALVDEEAGREAADVQSLARERAMRDLTHLFARSGSRS